MVLFDYSGVEEVQREMVLKVVAESLFTDSIQIWR